MEIKRTLADGTEVTFELTPREVCDAWEEQEQMDAEMNVRQRLSDMIQFSSDGDAETIRKVLLDEDLVSRCALKTREYRDSDDMISEHLWGCVFDAVRYVFEREGIVLDTY